MNSRPSLFHFIFYFSFFERVESVFEVSGGRREIRVSECECSGEFLFFSFSFYEAREIFMRGERE